jgi:hypothetical protein
MASSIHSQYKKQIKQMGEMNYAESCSMTELMQNILLTYLFRGTTGYLSIILQADVHVIFSIYVINTWTASQWQEYLFLYRSFMSVM